MINTSLRGNAYIPYRLNQTDITQHDRRVDAAIAMFSKTKQDILTQDLNQYLERNISAVKNDLGVEGTVDLAQRIVSGELFKDLDKITLNDQNRAKSWDSGLGLIGSQPGLDIVGFYNGVNNVNEFIQYFQNVIAKYGEMYENEIGQDVYDSVFNSVMTELSKGNKVGKSRIALINDIISDIIKDTNGDVFEAVAQKTNQNKSIVRFITLVNGLQELVGSSNSSLTLTSGTIDNKTVNTIKNNIESAYKKWFQNLDYLLKETTLISAIISAHGDKFMEELNKQLGNTYTEKHIGTSTFDIDANMGGTKNLLDDLKKFSKDGKKLLSKMTSKGDFQLTFSKDGSKAVIPISIKTLKIRKRFFGNNLKKIKIKIHSSSNLIRMMTLYAGMDETTLIQFIRLLGVKEIDSDTNINKNAAIGNFKEWVKYSSLISALAGSYVQKERQALYFSINRGIYSIKDIINSIIKDADKNYALKSSVDKINFSNWNSANTYIDTIGDKNIQSQNAIKANERSKKTFEDIFQKLESTKAEIKLNIIKANANLPEPIMRG